MDADGQRRRQLTSGDHLDERPCTSPDGRLVVFASDRSGSINLWMLDRQSSRLRQLTNHDSMAYRPIFSPDGRHLAYFTPPGPGSAPSLCILEWESGTLSWPIDSGQFEWVHGPFWLSGGGILLVHAKRRGIVSLWTVNLADKSIEIVRLPGFTRYGHGSLNREETVLVFDSPEDIS
jgi:WD40 repeat protein